MNPVAAAGPHLGGAVAPDVSPVRLALALLACLVIAALAILMLRQRLGRGGPVAALRRWGATSSDLIVEEVRRVGLHGDVALVRHGGREYLLLVQAGAASVLRERDIGAHGAAAP